MKRIRRRIATLLLATLIIVGGGTAWANWAVQDASSARIFTNARSVPARPVGIVLGTTPKIHGLKNLFFERRLDAAAALYKAGKVHCLLVSGDHGTRYYNEVGAMEKGLVKRGVPAAKIAEDHAGFRTLDSVVRAKKIFGIDRAVIVTDGFHLPRSLYLASHSGIDAVGLSSVPVPMTVTIRPQFREIGARVLMMLDLLVNRQPRFLGPREHLPS
jgi:SanA protein